jgi:hypothetical protein
VSKETFEQFQQRIHYAQLNSDEIKALKQRIAELEAEKAELLSAMGEAFSFKINTELGRMSPTREALALSNVTRLLAQQPAKQESKLLTETHLPDLDDNLAKLSITL